MPYNKGDFTQQGIAGDVTSLVRLNEKRTVKLTLSADDASDNCDISGFVRDELNDKTYPIGAGVSGNIEITENGENINVAPYATATVNVAGGGEMSLKHLTFNIVNNLDEPVGVRQGAFVIYGCVIIRDDLLNSTFSIDSEQYQFDLNDYVSTVPSGTTTSIVLPYITYDDSEFVAVAFGSYDTINKVTYNNMTYDSDNNGLAVTDVTENSVMTYTPTK